MNQDAIDLLKVLAATALVFAAGTLALLYVILLAGRYGTSLPLPRLVPPEMVPVLANGNLFATLAAVHVTATGLALLLTSNTIDMALLITAKAAAVVLTAMLGFAGGHMIFGQLNGGAAPSLQPLTPTLIALIAFVVLSTLLSPQNLRRFGNFRFLLGLVLIVAGPALLVWL